MSTSGSASAARAPATNPAMVLAEQANRLQQQEQQIQELIAAINILSNRPPPKAAGRDTYR